MTDKFDTSLPPFDRLTTTEQQTLRKALDVVYFRAGETVITAGDNCHQLYIIIKGNIEEYSTQTTHNNQPHKETFAHYANDDLFDVSAQLKGQSRHAFKASEDTICYALPRELFVQCYQDNHQFAAYFDTDLSKRQALLDEAHHQQNLAEFILTKIDDDNIQPCLVVPHDTSLLAVTQQMKNNELDAAFVTLNSLPQYGIVTRTDLLHATLLDGYAPDSAVSSIASTPVVSVNKGDYLFNAMLAMTRQKVKRVQVCDNNAVVGMLDLTQVLSLFSTHSHVLTLRIARAETIEELALAANSQQTLVETLFNNGIRTLFVMELIAAVNEQIIEKAFKLIVPTHYQPHCCLVVMGSEGRGEQILKTDQDNALIIEDDIDWPDCHGVMAQLTHTLQQLGYPLCPGNVMVSNPHWVKSQQVWLQHIPQLCRRGDPDSMMELAILADSHAVAGNPALLTPLQACLHQQLADQERLLTTFTRPALQFSIPLTIFGNLKAGKHGLNIKQGGIFPIVHGIRALALEHNISPNNTFERIAALTALHVLEQRTADNLTEALKLFIKLRLHQQLSQQKDGQQHHLDISTLSRAERDVLRHSLHVVKKFKEWLGYHYQIRD
ncbi:putative nucleotidyltransferase substrate binding domain-containing protein [Photobacterium kagoshimensis]|uniref:putative nucleotidyltransferase substrate binding domain-containing protein n=1 Tax=Photobacterium kagoshimensis TaxID=2910242 RepID=UPI003D0DB9F2